MVLYYIFDSHAIVDFIAQCRGLESFKLTGSIMEDSVEYTCTAVERNESEPTKTFIAYEKTIDSKRCDFSDDYFYWFTHLTDFTAIGILSDEEDSRIHQFMPLIRENNKNLREILKISKPFYNDSVLVGLSEEVAGARLKEQGRNVVECRCDCPLWTKFVRAFFTWFSPLLWAAVILLVGFVLAAIVSTSQVVFWRDLQTRKTLQHSYVSTDSRCYVIRDGNTKEISSTDIVVGDLVTLNAGCVPADVRLVSSPGGMRVDKSILTGDNKPVDVGCCALEGELSYLAASNTVFMGTTVVEGSGTAMVIATGDSTQIGKIAHSETGHKSGHIMVQQEIHRTVSIVSAFAVFSVVVLVVMWASYFRFEIPRRRKLPILVISLIGVLVAFVPFGFPVVLNLGMVLIARKLQVENHVLGKRLGIGATLGAMTTLMVDAALIDPQVDSACVRVAAWTSAEINNCSVVPPLTMSTAHTIATICSADGATNPAVVDSTVWNWLEQEADTAAVVTRHLIHDINRCPSTTAVLATCMLTGETFVYLSGDVDQVLAKCVRYLDERDCVVPLSSLDRDRLADMFAAVRITGHSVVCLAQSASLPQVTGGPVALQHQHANEFTFVAGLVVSRPQAEDVRDSLRQIREARIKIAVISGETDPAVAQKKACDVGLVDQNASINTLRTLHCVFGAALRQDNNAILVTGSETEKMTSIEWAYVLTHNIVIFVGT
eukprot:gene28479-35335_t